MRDARSFGRNGPKYRSQERVLVYCEDTHSSLLYLRRASQVLRANAEVKVAHCGNTDPLGIVNAALAKSNQYEHIYCVIDRDTHENFHEARELSARFRDKVTLIISNPCFEYWLILHFAYTRKPYARAGNTSPAAAALKHLRRLPNMDQYQKGEAKNVFDELYEKLPVAVKNARRSMRDAIESDEFNPTTQINELLEKFQSLAKPKLAN